MYLGYDPGGDEFKALLSTALYGENFQEHKILIFRVGSDLSWRDIKDTQKNPALHRCNRWNMNQSDMQHNHDKRTQVMVEKNMH